MEPIQVYVGTTFPGGSMTYFQKSVKIWALSLSFLLASSIIPLSACAQQSSELGPVLTDPVTTLSQQKVQWSEAAVKHYRYRLVVDCFCPYGSVPVDIEVSPNQSPIVRDAATGEIIKDSFFTPYQSMDSLFGELQRESGLNRSDDIVATGKFDQSYGFPEEFEILYNSPRSDETIRISIENFESLQ